MYRVIGCNLPRPGQNILFYLNHPIKWVRLVGVVVAFDPLPNRFVFGLDDSSGFNIEITCERPKGVQTTLAQDTNVPNACSAGQLETSTKGCTASGREVELAGIDIGVVVKAKGTIGVFRGARQLLLERIAIVRTTNEEAVAWTENTAFHDDVLSKPWNLSEKEQRRAKTTAEGSDRGKQLRTGRRKEQEDKNHKSVREQVQEEMVMERERRKKAKVRKLERLEREKELRRHLRRREEVDQLKKQAMEASGTSQLGAKRKNEQESLVSEDQKNLIEQKRMENGGFLAEEKLRLEREADRAERERVFAMHVNSNKRIACYIRPATEKPSRKERRTDHF